MQCGARYFLRHEPPEKRIFNLLRRYWIFTQHLEALDFQYFLTSIVPYVHEDKLNTFPHQKSNLTELDVFILP